MKEFIDSISFILDKDEKYVRVTTTSGEEYRLNVNGQLRRYHCGKQRNVVAYISWFSEYGSRFEYDMMSIIHMICSSLEMDYKE